MHCSVIAATNFRTMTTASTNPGEAVRGMWEQPHFGYCLPAASTFSRPSQKRARGVGSFITRAPGAARTSGMTLKSCTSLVMTGQQYWVRGQYTQENAKVKS